MLDVLLVANVAVVRVMQESFDAIEHDAETRAVRRLDRGAEVIQQGFNLAPVDVAAQRILEDRAQQILVLMAQERATGMP